MDWDAPFGRATDEEIQRAWSRRLVDPRGYAMHPDRPGGVVPDVIQARRYGGDLQGVYRQLGSLKAQGFTGIYLCPVFESRSLHKYDASDHRHIDPTLGDPGVYHDPGPGHTALGADEDPFDESTWAWTAADRWFVDVFLPGAKALGLRVVLDGVWNHVGVDHFAFHDVVVHGRESRFADWFDVEFDRQGKLVAWRGWGNRLNGNLPEFRKTPDRDLVDGPRRHMMAVTRRWMDPDGDGDPSDGIDGWRLDVAGEIGASFWKDWRKQVKSVNPDALIIAEIWGDADSMLSDDAFDGQMNYPFAYAVADWLSIGDSRADASVCARRLASVFHHDPEHDLVQLNLMSSHDTERLASLMHNDLPRGYDNGSNRWTRRSRYDPETVTDEDRRRALAAIAVMVASPGAPMIYNGDEYALPGADDPDNRRPIPWSGLESDGTAQRFNRAVSSLLLLRSDPIYRDLLRFGNASFDSLERDGGPSALLVRRRLDDRVLEMLISPGASWGADLDPWDPEPGFEVLGESQRKFGVRTGESFLAIRVLVGQESPIRGDDSAQ